MPDSTAADGAALTGALSEYVQSPTLSNDTLDYSSDGSGSASGIVTPQLLIKQTSAASSETAYETIVIDDSKKLEVNVEAVTLEQFQVEEGPAIISDQNELNSFKKREIKCRNIRKSDNSLQRTVSPPQRPKSVEKSKPKYPASWAEYKELGIDVKKHLALKSKLLKHPKDTKFDFKKYFNFETPPSPLEAFKSHSKSGIVWIQFPYLRCTITRPPVIYSSKERGYLNRQQLFALIPKNRQQVIEKLMKTSKGELDCKPLMVRKWFSKNWKKTDKIEGKVVENSVGLSFLQIYSDEENVGKVVSRTPPFAEEKEEGEVSDDDYHNQSISMMEEIREIKKTKEELEATKEELEKLEESLRASEGLAKIGNEVPKKKRKKVKISKVSKSIKSKKKPKKKKSSKVEECDENKKPKFKKKRKNLKPKDKDSQKKKKSTTKNDLKKKKKKKPIGTKSAKLEIHPDYQDDIKFFADRLDAERQLKGKTKHKTKINISLEEFHFDKDSEVTSTSSQKKEEFKVDLLKMNEEYLREQKRKDSKERSCSKEKIKKQDVAEDNKRPKKEADSVLDNIKQEPNAWESDQEILIDNQLVRTPDPKPLDLEMPLNIKTYCRRDIEKDNVDLQFDIATTPKKGRWDIKNSTTTKKPEELTVLEDEYEEFMKAVTDTIVIDGSFEEIKPVPAPSPKTIQKPLINLSLSANVTQNITLSVTTPITSSVQISTPNLVTVSTENSSIAENITSFSIHTHQAEKDAASSRSEIINCDANNIPSNCEDVTSAENLSIDNVATSENIALSVSQEIITNLKEIETVDNYAITESVCIDKNPPNIAEEMTSYTAIDSTIIPEIMNFSIPTKNNPASHDDIMNLSIPHVLSEKDTVNNLVTTINKDVPIQNYSNNLREEIMNFSSPTKSIPDIMNYSISKINNFPDKDAFNIPLDKDIDKIECEWKQTFKPIMLPTKNLLGSSKLNLEDFDGHDDHLDQTFETSLEESKGSEASPAKKNKNSTSKNRRDSDLSRKKSPIRKRRDFSPKRKRSPLKRHNSPRSRRTSSPKRRPSPRRRRSPSPRKKSKYSPSRDKKPRRLLSPLKHLPDSTISDDQLPQIAHALVKEKPNEESPQRLPLDIRISQALGLEVGHQPSPKQFSQYPEQCNNFAVSVRPQQQSTYKQVGNMLQIVPVEEEPLVTNLDPPRQQTYKQFQHPNLFASTPLQPRSQILQIGNMLEIVPTDMVQVEPRPHQPEIKTEKVDEDLWYASKEADAKPSAEAAMLQKEAERLAERENRRVEREKRKREKERRRKEREKLRQNKLKLKTEKMIKKALELEIDQMLQEPTDEAQVQWPPAPLVNHFSDFKGKSILVNKLGSLDLDKSNKTVQFADGIRPGEGTSPSAGEELFSPPPPVLPKEKRFKKTLFGKKKGKKKAKAVKKPATVESDSEDSQQPPSPPPGSPPPHLFPPRIKVKPVNNVPAALLASIIQTAQQQQYQQYRPTINMMMAPPPPPPQGHHSQSPSLPPVSPQLHAGLSAPPLPPQPGHSRHF